MRKFILITLLAAAMAMPVSARPLAANAFPHPVPQYLAAIITDASKAYGVDPNLIAAVAFHESRFNVHEVSNIGASGLMQLLPSTARANGVHDIFDPRENIFGGTRYLKKQLDRFGGDVDRALAAYNVGADVVKKNGPGAAAHYVAAVKAIYDAA